MKKVLTLVSIFSMSAQAHESLAPHTHPHDMSMLHTIDTVVCALFVLAAALFAVLVETLEAREVPTVMIFSSSTNGLSHTKEEDTPVEHLHMAADAFHRTCVRAIDLVAAGQL